MNIKSILDSLNLLYYEYDVNNHIIKAKHNSPKFYLQRELTKITYYLARKNIIFDVLGNKSILVGSKESFFSKVKRIYTYMHDRD